jgi:hypothetical protein
MFTIQVQTTTGGLIFNETSPNGSWVVYTVAGSLIGAMNAWRVANRKGYSARILNEQGNVIHN